MDVLGTVTPRFEKVRDVLTQVIRASPGTGSAVCVWHDGEVAVDWWGGYRDEARTLPWQRESLVVPYSVTKPFTAVCLLVLADRGLVQLDAPMSTYWPEFRAAATLRQVLSHTAGVVVLEDPAPTRTLFDWDAMVDLIARQPPLWVPGKGVGESALLYGHLLGEVVRRVDGRSLGTFLADEICKPHGLEFHIGLHGEDLPRAVDLTGYDDEFRRLVAAEDRQMLRAMSNPPGALDPEVVNSAQWRRAEIPAVNGHGTARGVAGLYVALATGRLLSNRMLEEMTTVTGAGLDQVVGTPACWGLGVGIEPGEGWGMGGTGGTFGWWSEAGGYAMSFVTGHISDDDRGARVENAVRAAPGLAPA